MASRKAGRGGRRSNQRNNGRGRNQRSTRRNSGFKGRRKRIVTKISIPIPECYTVGEYFLPKELWYKGKISVKTDGHVFSTLKRVFTPSQLELFRKSCFGYLLDVQDLDLNAQLIHQVLIREIKRDEADAMWFDFNGELVRFSLEQFCLISGMPCVGEGSRAQYCGKFNRLKLLYFSKYSCVDQDAITEVFTGKVVKDDRDQVNIGILLMLTSYMYTCHYHKSVEDSLMVLVDSEDRDRYPWGLEIFNFLLEKLKAGLRNKSASREGNARPTIGYRLNGFLFAFQIWIYETFPALQGLCCTKVGSQYPRILNWSSSVPGLKLKVDPETDFFSMPKICVRAVQPDSAEMVMPYAKTLYEDCVPEHVYIIGKDKGLPDNDTVGGKADKCHGRVQELEQFSRKELIPSGDQSCIPSTIKRPTSYDEQAETSIHQERVDSKTARTDLPISHVVDKNRPVVVLQTHTHSHIDSSTSTPRRTVFPVREKGSFITDVQDRTQPVRERPMTRSNVNKTAQSNADSPSFCVLSSPGGARVTRSNAMKQPVDASMSTDRLVHLTLVKAPLFMDGDAQTQSIRERPVTRSNASRTTLVVPKTSTPTQMATQGVGSVSRSNSMKKAVDLTTITHAHPVNLAMVSSTEIGQLSVNGQMLPCCVGFQNLQVDSPVMGLQTQPQSGRKQHCTGPSAMKELQFSDTDVQDLSECNTNQSVQKCLDSLDDIEAKEKKLKEDLVNCQEFTAEKFEEHRETIISVIERYQQMMKRAEKDLKPLASKSIRSSGSDNQYLIDKIPENSNLVHGTSLPKEGGQSSEAPQLQDPHDLDLDFDTPSFDLITSQGDEIVRPDPMRRPYVTSSTSERSEDRVFGQSGKKRKQASNIGNPHSSHLLHDDVQVTPEFLKQMDDTIEHFKSSEGKHTVKEFSPIPFSLDTQVTPEAKTPRATTLGRFLRSPYVQLGSSDLKTKDEVHHISFDYVLCLDLPKIDDVDVFESWMSLSRPRKSMRTRNSNRDIADIHPPMHLGPIKVDKRQWWHNLQEVGTALHSTHIDAMFYYFRIHMLMNDGHPVKATSTDCYFSVRAKHIHNLRQKRGGVRNPQNMQLYPLGEQIDYSCNWATVDYVFIPIFMESRSHWVLGVLDIPNWQLLIYNSLRSVCRDRMVLDDVEHIRYVVPMIVRNSGILSRPIALTPIPCFVVTDIPQQENGGDCGIFIIKYAEYIYQKKLHEMAQPFDTVTCRKSMAVQLYKFATEQPETKLKKSPTYSSS